MSTNGSAIRVALRIRPEPASDENLHTESCVNICSDKTVQIARKRELTGQMDQAQYTFDHVFSPTSTQEDVFSSVRDLINEALLGFNVTIFAFGMTGSGKTHTISGNQSQPGIVPRAVHHVYSSLRAHATTHKESVAMVFLTFVELYNNTLYDLLSGLAPHTTSLSPENGPLKIHEHPTRGIQLSGSSTLRTPVGSAEEVLGLINKGYKVRATASTNLNERSSRSHTVITLEIVSSSPSSSSGESTTSYGKINLVDLAGSERVKASGAEGQTLTEAKQINKALSVLGDVLNALSKHHSDDSPSASHSSAHTGTREIGYVPYRNSKLTMLLKDSLGGNAKTVMIATIRPSLRFISQTIMSLQYAARARHIKCHPISTITMNTTDTSHTHAKALLEIGMLKQALEARTIEYESLKKKMAVLQSREKGSDGSGGMGGKVDEIAANSRGNANTGSGMGAEEIALMDQYKRQIDELQQRSARERLLLQV